MNISTSMFRTGPYKNSEIELEWDRDRELDRVQEEERERVQEEERERERELENERERERELDNERKREGELARESEGDKERERVVKQMDILGTAISQGIDFIRSFRFKLILFLKFEYKNKIK